jgi:hypothetical protein
MLNSDVYWITWEMDVTCDLLCWITTILASMLVGLKSLVISLDYRSYMGSSARIWSFRWLFLYLCSYNLDGSVTFDACTLLSGDRVEMCSKVPTALFGLEAINRGGAQAWVRLSTLGMCCPCVCLVWESSNSLVLARSANPLRVCDSSALHHEVALSGTRWSSCKLVVLVTLGDCHLLDVLVVVSVEARKEDCAVLRRSDCEGYCAHPAGAAKSNSSRACHRATLTFGVGSCGAQHVSLASDNNQPSNHQVSGRHNGD